MASRAQQQNRKEFQREKTQESQSELTAEKLYPAIRDQLLQDLRQGLRSAEELEVEDPDSSERSSNSNVKSLIAEHFSGPLPRPDHCEKYEELLPGFTDRSLKIAENAQADTSRMFKRRDWMSFISRMSGQIFAFSLMALFLVGAFFLFKEGKNGPGWAAMIAGFVTISLAFLSKSKRKSAS